MLSMLMILLPLSFFLFLFTKLLNLSNDFYVLRDMVILLKQLVSAITVGNFYWHHSFSKPFRLSQTRKQQLKCSARCPEAWPPTPATKLLPKSHWSKQKLDGPFTVVLSIRNLTWAFNLKTLVGSQGVLRASLISVDRQICVLQQRKKNFSW